MSSRVALLARFFAYLTTLIIVLYDTYRPVRAARDARRSLPGP